MKTTTAAILIVLAVCAPVQKATAVEGARDLTVPEYDRMLTRVMDGRPSLAHQELEALADTCAGRPLYLLARARLALEAIPLDDDDKTFAKDIAASVYPLLDEVVRYCDAGLEQDESRLDLVRYRGWSWMVRSQVKAYVRSFYAAGRDAGKGKNDLETYLKAAPDDAVANGMLGAFLYFSDAVPQLFQFLSKLLFLPTGDRDRGLAMIRAAVENDSQARVDFEVLDARVHFFFEGRFEEGLALANDLLARYPRYPRLAMASATMAPLDPQRAASHLARSGRVLDELTDEQGLDEASLTSLRALQGWSARLVQGHAAARGLLTDLAAAPPSHPDWSGSFAELQLAQMAAQEGRVAEARRRAERSRKLPGGDRLAEQAERLLDDLTVLDRSGTATRDPVQDAWVAALYSGDPDSLQALADRFDAHAAGSVRAAFHAAETRMLTGDLPGATGGYRAVYRREVAAWEMVYRLLAAVRLGELAAAQGNYRNAANWLERAARDNGNQERVEWLLQGRSRYFAELHER